MASEHRVGAPHISKPLAKEQTDGEAQRKAPMLNSFASKVIMIKSNSPLLHLPAEIRNMIFEQVFVNRVITLGRIQR
ncbi:unnamed protein product [Alternaria alternata]